MTNRTPDAASVTGQVTLRAPLTGWLRPWHWVAIDGVVAVLLALVFLVGSTRPAYGIPLWVTYLLALVSTLPVAVRRLWPLPVLGVVLAGSAAAMAIGTGKDPSVAVALVLYLVALRYPRSTSAAVLAGVLALTAAGTIAGGAALEHNQASAVAARFTGSAVVLTAAWVIGVAVRQQRAYTAGLREQAERRVQAQLAEGRRAATEERLRIARELHDVVPPGVDLAAYRIIQEALTNVVKHARTTASRVLVTYAGDMPGGHRRRRRRPC